MSFGKLIAVFLLLISFKASSQNSLLKGDYAEAVTLNINQTYTFKISALGFGGRQEYPPNKKHANYIFEKERNTAWFSLTIPSDGFLAFEITPLQMQDDYDWMLFKETSISTNNQSIDYEHPVRTNNSRNDLSINSKTGLKDGFTDNVTPPGLGKGFSKPVHVHSGENYILVVDNVYPGGKGFTFFSSVQSVLPSQVSAPVISGTVSDQETGQPMAATLSAQDGSGHLVAATISDTETGKFSLKISSDARRTISIYKKGYVLFNDFIPVKTASSVQNYQLQKLKTDARIVFYNIRFLPNSAVIVDTSGADLDRLFHFLNEEQSWKIRIIGHTNANIFTDEQYLQRLSEKRALAVKTYLLQHGIANNRMRCFGLGGKSPLYDNKKPEEAVKNLRVEVVLER